VRPVPAPLVILSLLPLFSGGIPAQFDDRGGLRYGVLVPDTTTMASAWDVPRNPLTDTTLGASPLGDRIRWGYRLFISTPREAPAYARNKLSCANCHLNAGQRERALPLVGIAAVFPEYNKREARSFTLEDRIVGCFMRSENATGMRQGGAKAGHGEAGPDTASAEVAALASYISWLSEGLDVREKLPWRGQNLIAAGNCIPVAKLDPGRGKELYMRNCVSCHGEDGQGVQIGDRKAGPLWGPDSWNDGAGAARVYTLAGMIRYAMPYLNPGSLTDEEAQSIAAFINSKPRPDYPFKEKDYRAGGLPPDAVYYKKRP